MSFCAKAFGTGWLGKGCLEAGRRLEKRTLEDFLSWAFLCLMGPRIESSQALGTVQKCRRGSSLGHISLVFPPGHLPGPGICQSLLSMFRPGGEELSHFLDENRAASSLPAGPCSSDISLSFSQHQPWLPPAGT